MWTTPDLFRVVSVALSAVLAAVLVRDHRQDPSARATLVLLAASCGHMLAHMFTRMPQLAPLSHLCAVLAAAVPFCFWYLTKVHFDDEPRLRPWHLVALAVLVGTRYTGWRVTEGLMAVSDGMRLVWAVLPRLVGIAFVVHALLNVYVGTRFDLVLPRLRLRYSVLGVVGTYVLIELSTQAVFAGRGQAAAAEDLHGYAGGLLLLGIGVVAFRLQPELLRPARALPEPAGPPLDPRLVERLRELIDAEAVFRQEGLTVASLAQRIGTQEARLRQVINVQLGFKNFNAFLHHYRIAEARRVLADPAQRHRSVAEIAYEVGYASLGPFNRAFKDLAGVTPTEFRAAADPKSLADSGIGQLSGAKQQDG